LAEKDVCFTLVKRLAWKIVPEVTCNVWSPQLNYCAVVCRIILFNYLAQTGKACGLTAAMTVSIAWNCFASARSLEQPINALIFNKMLADELKQAVVR